MYVKSGGGHPDSNLGTSRQGLQGCPDLRVGGRVAHKLSEAVERTGQCFARAGVPNDLEEVRCAVARQKTSGRARLGQLLHADFVNESSHAF